MKKRDAIDEDINVLERTVYFAAGNHEILDRELFESRYGAMMRPTN
jgi:hypothetical protein